MVLLHILRSFADLSIFTLILRKAHGCTVGRSYARWTVTWKCGKQGQKDSNLNLACLHGTTELARKSGQWSELAVDASISTELGNKDSQLRLQKNLSILTSVGFCLSLLHVNLWFLHLISQSSATSNAARNLPMILLFKFRLFLSLAS